MSNEQSRKIIVFTDLDGCLLDHDDYNFEAAAPLLAKLAAQRVPVIPTTSKTVAEIKAMPIAFEDVPLISENGMVIDFPPPGSKGLFAGESRHHIGLSYDEIIAFLDELPSDLRQHIRGFHDMSAGDVVAATGLSPDQAVLAKTRLASEPFLWAGDEVDMTRLRRLAEAVGLVITRGGRFYHLMSLGGKQTAARRLMAKYREMFPGDKMISIGLGDSYNDILLLSLVDYGIIIPNKKGGAIDVDKPQGQIIRAEMPGPEGWAAALGGLLQALEVRPLNAAK